jgi:anti-anti-sigma factor
MDSTGLRSLLVSEELCSVNSCQLLVGRLSPQVARLLELSGLEGRLPRVSPTD